MALLHVSYPPAQTCGGEDILYIFFLIFPGHLELWTPLQISVWGPPLGCTLLHNHVSFQWLGEQMEAEVSRPLSSTAYSFCVWHGFQSSRAPAPEGACETILECEKMNWNFYYIEFYTFGIWF